MGSKAPMAWWQVYLPPSHIQDYAQRLGSLFSAGQIHSELIAEEQRLLQRFVKAVPFDQINDLRETVIYQDLLDSPFLFKDCLKQVFSEAQPSLMQNLLYLELEHRRDRVEQPEVQGFLDRFPE